jgi:membrane-associated protease RseP (regulator of RpoE activity)
LDNRHAFDRDGLTPRPAPPDEDLAEAQLPLRVWLVRNGTSLVLMLAILAFLYFYFGGEGLWTIAKVALGLGFVVFFHELGHFAVAKWCDVHVKTFSIGFGPALPGCSFQKGETTYKIAMLPLGGYVNMVGEGNTEDGDEDNPRSFKNKSVWQRMAIISAGVVMNVILGCVCFIAVYTHGIRQTPAIAAALEPGSPAWAAGVRSGWKITQVDGIHNPFFEDVTFQVRLSNWGEKVLFVLANDGRQEKLEIEPRRDRYDPHPVVGIAPPQELKVLPERLGRRNNIPPTTGPAAAGRRLDLNPGDVIVATTDPDDEGTVKALPADPNGRDYAFELTQRFRRLAGKPLVIHVRRQGAAGGAEPEALTLTADGFSYDDVIVGTTDAGAENTPYSPFRVLALPYEDLENGAGRRYDYFEFMRRVQLLAGRPVVVQVRRAADGPDAAPVPVLVPPAFPQTRGLKMTMGKVAAVRDKSPASRAGVREGDVIQEVRAYDARGHKTWTAADLDPMRLPHELAAWADGRSGVKVALTVLRQGENGPVLDLDWDESWRFNLDKPLGPRSPVAVAELGLAYQVEPTVQAVEPWAAAEAGPRAGDVVREVRFKQRGKPGDWSPWVELWDKDSSSPEKKSMPWWAGAFTRMQEGDLEEAQVKVLRNGQELPSR